MQTLEIPPPLQSVCEAALAWYNQQHGVAFELTGLVDSDTALAAAPGESFDLGLVLCDGELCARETVRCEPSGAAFAFSLVPLAAPEIPPLLDPPAGVRLGWLDQVLGRHEFVLLMFYRGLW